jgi:hypothetical protein
MSDQTLMLDLSDLTVESVEVVPTDSLESATTACPSLPLPVSS